jgi:hypothetical protein
LKITMKKNNKSQFFYCNHLESTKGIFQGVSMGSLMYR